MAVSKARSLVSLACGGPVARRTFVLGALVVQLLGVRLVSAQTPPRVVDLHVDLPYQINYKGASILHASGQTEAAWLLGSGVAGLVLPLYVPHEVSPTGPRMLDLETSYARMLGLLQQTAPYLVPGQAPANGRVATWFSLEGAAPFAGRCHEIKKWVTNGVRIWGLVHIHDNAIATSAGRGPGRARPSAGLTEAGFEVVRAIHAAGGLVDVSHASDRTVSDVIGVARAAGVAVVATHSNADRLLRHTRNLKDDQLRAIASTGGVIGVNFHGKFLARGRRATLDDVVRQIRYMVDLVGIDHVGIGSDYEGGIQAPEELKDVRGYPVLANALYRVGFTQAQVAQVFSGNALRLLADR